MSTPLPTTRRAYRRTDDFTPNTPKLSLTTLPLPTTLPPTHVLIRIHAVALNYRDANIAHGGNPWPVIPHGIICNDAAGSIIAVGSGVETLKVGDRVAPIVDTKNLTNREEGRSWLAADEEGVLADYVVFDEKVVVRLPGYLAWREACTVPCAGVTAWSALKGVGVGGVIVVQGTGGVSTFALKLALASGIRVILTSSSDAKLERLRKQYASSNSPPLHTVNYATTPNWHEEVLRLTNGAGADLVLENGGTSSLVKSVKCTRRGGIVSQVGYLGKQDGRDLEELLPVLIDRRVNLKGINAGSKQDTDDLCAALDAVQMRLDDLIDAEFPFDKAEEALQYLWEGKQVGKVVVTL